MEITTANPSIRVQEVNDSLPVGVFVEYLYTTSAGNGPSYAPDDYVFFILVDDYHAPYLPEPYKTYAAMLDAAASSEGHAHLGDKGLKEFGVYRWTVDNPRILQDTINAASFIGNYIKEQMNG